ncbi:hypothetical protein CC78DRAFT_309750 [Lojkania enalia]|uniref:Uncharacterized protein n=1 Tax=Lojkania enalia TaxID=147567 RepID=A0A9P4K5V8_9PLEO|nr:hypothetical protein CC78DRAFT_309750 [Didymosphaeria enalia]
MRSCLEPVFSSLLRISPPSPSLELPQAQSPCRLLPARASYLAGRFLGIQGVAALAAVRSPASEASNDPLNSPNLNHYLPFIAIAPTAQRPPPAARGY